MNPILNLFLLLVCLSAPALAQTNSVSSSSSSSSQSVTVTSDGKSTVKKTVTTRDGVTTTTTEITDDKGNVVTTTVPGHAGGNAAAGPADGTWIGLRTKEASPELRDQLGLAGNEGLVVDLAAPGGPAAKAGLQERDLILSLDGAAVGTVVALRAAVQSKKPGDKIEVAYLRKGQRQTTQVTLEKPAPGAPADGEPNQAQKILDDLRKGGAFPNLPPIDVKVNGTGGAALDDLLKDPNVPETIKEQLREMRKRLKL